MHTIERSRVDVCKLLIDKYNCSLRDKTFCFLKIAFYVSNYELFEVLVKSFLQKHSYAYKELHDTLESFVLEFLQTGSLVQCNGDIIQDVVPKLQLIKQCGVICTDSSALRKNSIVYKKYRVSLDDFITFKKRLLGLDALEADQVMTRSEYFELRHEIRALKSKLDHLDKDSCVQTLVHQTSLSVFDECQVLTKKIAFLEQETKSIANFIDGCLKRPSDSDEHGSKRLDVKDNF